MALTGVFEADFTSFYSAVNTAKDSLRDMAGAAETTGQAVADIVDGNAPESMHELAAATDEVASANTGAGISIAAMTVAMVAAEAIVGALGAAYTALTDVVKQSITSASEAEDAQAGLTAALTAQGTAVPSVVAAYGDYATALQLTTRYSDDAVTAAEKILVQIGDVMPRDMQRALKATTDLAAGLGIDLPAAAMLVAKAADGNTSALQRYGVQVDTAKGETAAFTDVLTAIDARFKGTAETMAGTFAGGLDQAANAWDNLLESVGRTITQNETVRTALASLNDVLVTNTGELNQNATANQLVSEAVILVAKGAAYLVDAFDFLQKAATEVVATIQGLNAVILNYGIAVAEAARSGQQLALILHGGFDDTARKNIAILDDYLVTLHGRFEENRAAVAALHERSNTWSAGLQTLSGNLDTFITQLEATKGQTVAVTAAQAEAAGVWDKTTGAISAQTMAAQEHAMAMEGVSKGMFQIDAQATALAKATDANVMAEIKGRQDAEAAFWKMHDAEEQAAIAASQGAKQTVADVQQIDGAVQTLTGTFEAAGTSYANMLSAQQQLTQDYINYAYTSPGSVAKGTLGQSFLVDPSTGQIQPRAAGGPVSAGSTYLVGEDGPELFRPGSSGMIHPGGGAQIVIAPGAFTLNYPIVNNPQALDQLARTVGDALLTKLTRTGARL